MASGVAARMSRSTSRVLALPNRRGGGEQRTACGRENETAAAPVTRIDCYLHQTASLERLEIGGQRRAIQREQIRHRPHVRRLRAVQRCQQRKLALGQTHRTQRLVETARQRARRALRVQAKAMIANMRRERERCRVFGLTWTKYVDINLFVKRRNTLRFRHHTINDRNPHIPLPRRPSCTCNRI